MNYSLKNSARRGKVRVKSLSGGVNLREQSAATEDNQFAQLCNMWYKNGCLENRPAIAVNLENKLYDVDSAHAFFTEFHILASKIAPTVEFSRMAMSKEFFDSMVRLKFFLIGEDGVSKEVAHLDFTRTSFNIFSMPHVNSAFYVPNTSGSGIHLMVTMYNYESSENGAHVRFYELSGDHTVWNEVTEERLYVPTVYINGRGNNFGAVFADSDFSAPQFAEPRSMLTGKFKCLFTTDGLSSNFRLPFDKLDNMAITCRFKCGLENYVWTVAAGKTISSVQRVQGADIEMWVDRSAGVITFHCGSVESALPISAQNSLEISAYKTELGFLEALKSSSIYCEHSSRIFISGLNGQINGVYFSAQSNPFYFPQQNKLYLGSAAQGITALCQHGKLLIAFKESKTYSITSKSVGEYNLQNVISGTEKLPTLSNVCMETLSEEIGCDCPKTVLNCGNHLVWLSSRGAVYTIVVANQYSKGNVYELSLNIEAELRNMETAKLKSAVACIKDGYYIIFIGNKAIVMDYTAKGFRYVSTCSDQKSTSRGIFWYFWEFPKEISFENAFSFGNDSVLICSRVDDECYWYGTAVLAGIEDCIPKGNYETLQMETAEINCFLKTKSFDFDESGINKFLKKAYLCIKSDATVSVTLYDGDKKRDEKVFNVPCDTCCTKELYFLNSRCREIALSIAATGHTQIRSLQLEAVITEN